MQKTASRASDRASQFVRDALLRPEQVNDIVLTTEQAQAKVGDKKPSSPTHAHGDFGHADR
jgi:hypothetical protein